MATMMLWPLWKCVAAVWVESPSQICISESRPQKILITLVWWSFVQLVKWVGLVEQRSWVESRQWRRVVRTPTHPKATTGFWPLLPPCVHTRTLSLLLLLTPSLAPNSLPFTSDPPIWLWPPIPVVCQSFWLHTVLLRWHSRHNSVLLGHRCQPGQTKQT